MAGISLTNNNDVYISDLVPVGAETSNNIMALGGDDQVQGNQYVDYIHGGSGNDTLWGMGGDDVLLGESGNDTLYGGTGEDLLLGGDNNDILYGGQGNDRLWGGTGDDSYVGYVSDSGIDTINDDKSPTGQTGYGGGNDKLFMQDVALADLFVTQSGNNLLITTNADAADGTMDSGIVIEDFFLGGNNVIEEIITSDNYVIDTTGWL